MKKSKAAVWNHKTKKQRKPPGTKASKGTRHEGNPRNEGVSNSHGNKGTGKLGSKEIKVKLGTRKCGNVGN